MQNRFTKKSIARENGYFVENPTLERCAKAIDKLGEIEDAEESGLMVRLPCKVGDTVYAYCKELSKVLPYFIEQIIIDYDPDNKNGYWVFNADSSNNEELLDSIDFTLDEIGKTVFLTREEAGKALEEDKQRAETEEV